MKRFVELDILRVIACFSVILIHTTSLIITKANLNGAGSYLFYVALNRGVQYAVPLFIFISGAALFYRYGKRKTASKLKIENVGSITFQETETSDKKFEYIPFLIKRSKTLLIPYFFCSALYYGYFIYMDYIAFDILDFLKKLISGGACYHLYFVPIIFQFYLLFGIIKKIVEKYTSASVLIVSFLLNLGACFIKELFPQLPYMQHFGKTFFMYLFFFIAGCCFAMNYSAIKKYLQMSWLLLLSGCFFFAGKIIVLSILYLQGVYANESFFNLCFWLVFCVVDIVLFVWLAGVLKEKVGALGKGVMKLIGDISYNVYLIHPLMIYLIVDLIDSRWVIMSRTVYFVILFAAVTISTFTICIIYRNLKGLPKNKKRRNRRIKS